MISTLRSVVSQFSSSPFSDIDPGHRKVLCVGLACIDIVQFVSQFPQEDTDTRCIDSRWQRGGNASNNCTVLKQLGVNCEFFGTIAQEDHHSFLVNDFHRRGINIDHCVFIPETDTPISTVIVNMQNGSRTILHINKNLPELDYTSFAKLNLAEYSWIHFEGRNEYEVVSMMESIENWNKSEGNQHQITVSVELEKPKPDLQDLIPLADVIFVGKDFAKFRGCVNMADTLKNIAKHAKKDAKVIVAWADRGAMGLLSPQLGGVVQSPAYPPLKLVDTLGAGDTFIAGVIASLEAGKPLDEALHRGCRLAGSKIGQYGFDGLDVENK